MALSITCEPPVGSATVVNGPTSTFIVAINDPVGCSSDVAIWHNGHTSRSWQALELQHVRETEGVHYFQGVLELTVAPVHFTLKFRVKGGDWQWLNDIRPHSNGLILPQAQKPPDHFEDYFEGWDPAWEIEQNGVVDSPYLSWRLTADEQAVSDSHSHWSSRSIGSPKDVVKWFALVRHSASWLGPRHGDAVFQPDKDAIIATFLRKDGLHVAVLPLNGVPDLLTVLHGDDKGNIIVVTRNDGENSSISAVLVAAAKTVHEAISVVMQNAKGLLEQRTPHRANIQTRTDDDDLERWYDAFTYCTWNGFGQQLNEDKLLAGLEKLARSGLDFSNLIIDDCWQSVNFKGGSNFDFKWTDFEANKEGFPHGLKHTVSRIREAHPNIKHVAVWHGIFGYWSGTDPDGEIARRYKIMEAPKRTEETYLSDGPMTTVQGCDVSRMYDDFYAFLVQSGIDSVKTDILFMPDYLADAHDRRDTIYTYQDAWLTAVEKHFQHRAVASMGQTPQMLFHAFLAPNHRPPYLTRNSDDFFPHEASSHAWHIFCNAHNSLLMQHLNVLPDWDMFQTAGQWAKVHAVARCLSGGPIYITDEPEQHDYVLIDMMTAKALDNRSIILRPEALAITMEPYNKPHSDRLLPLGTSHQGVSMLGLFNLSDRAIDQIVRLESFPRLDPKRAFILRSYFAGSVLGPIDLADTIPAFNISLTMRDAEVIMAAPLIEINRTRIAMLGLLDKISGAASIRSAVVQENDLGGVIAKVHLKAVGTFGVWLGEAREYLSAGKITSTFAVGRRIADVSLNQEGNDAKTNIVRLDVHSAWKSFGESFDASEGVLEIQVK